MNPFGDRRALAEFFVDWIEAAGGDVDRESSDLLAVLGPPALPSIAGRVVRVALDPALAREEEAALLAPGSALFVETFDAARRRGRVARAFLAGARLDPRAARGAVERALEAEDLRKEIVLLGTRWTPAVVFRFRVLFESEVREEEAVRIAVDGRTGRIARHLLAEFPSVLDAPFADFPRVEPIEARALHGIAFEELERRIAAEVNRKRREIASRVERERGRTLGYFERMLEELDESARRRSSGASVAAVFEARRRAILAERDRALAEVAAKDALSVSTRLTGLLLLEVPKVFFRATLAPAAPGPRLSPFETEVAFDPLAACVEAPSCPACGAATLRFALRRSSGPACERCAAVTAGGAAVSGRGRR